MKTLSRSDHSIAQTRELACTKIVLPQVMARGECLILLNRINLFFLGMNIVEVAHDMNSTVSSYITDELGLWNSYDTWHGNFISLLFMCILKLQDTGTKNVSKSLKPLTEGAQKRRNITWFPELTDKSKPLSPL